ncbi:MAG TPA: zf-HC2 domain-containing protein [Gemmatimonadales bacterium]|nr:zf-HC2 domain-containing protein [Gemmatimonadales bacterium]
MTCRDFEARADAYAEGRLSPRETAAFEAHLDRCAACAATLERAAGTPPGLAALRRSIEPAVDLWPAIHGRLASLGERPGRIALPRWGLAAAALLLIALSSGVTAVLLRPAPRVASATLDISALEAQYAAVSEDLSGALEKARSRLEPATLATIERNLRIIDAALDETRQALAKDPGNPALGQMVVAAWRQKVDLLRRATALGAES